MLLLCLSCITENKHEAKALYVLSYNLQLYHYFQTRYRNQWIWYKKTRVDFFLKYLCCLTSPLEGIPVNTSALTSHHLLSLSRGEFIMVLTALQIVTLNEIVQQYVRSDPLRGGCWDLSPCSRCRRVLRKVFVGITHFILRVKFNYWIVKSFLTILLCCKDQHSIKKKRVV